jgi:hypothetical protein
LVGVIGFHSIWVCITHTIGDFAGQWTKGRFRGSN